MRVAVFGTGGVGGFFGGHLARVGHDVTFVARGEHLAAIRRHGLRIESVDGDFTVAPAQATDDPAEIGPVDTVVVAVKTWQLDDAASAMRPLVDSGTTVLPLLNGVEAPEQLGRLLGRDRVVGGFCGIISFIAAPGVIRHTGYAPFVALGELDRSPSERCVRIRDAFVAAGINAVIPDDIRAAMWQKFLFITSFGGVAAVTRSTAGRFRSIPETRALLVDALHEVVRVAHAYGIALPQDAAAQALAAVDELPVDGTASMQRDIMDGRRSELEQQNGAIVRFGREAGVETPAHAFIYASLLPSEVAARAAHPSGGSREPVARP